MNTHYTLKTSLTYFFSLALATLFCVSFLTPLTAEAGGLFVDKNLTAGVRDPEAESLQKALNNLGFTVSEAGAGSTGNETTFFGQLTKNALTRFQAKNNLPADGVFDSVTRSKLNIFTALNLLQKNGISLPARTQSTGENTPTNGEAEGEAGSAENISTPNTLPPTTATQQTPTFGGASSLVGDLGAQIGGQLLDGLREQFDTFFDDLVNQVLDITGLGNLLSSFGFDVLPLSIGEGKPFGGQIIYWRECDCSQGYWVIIGPPKGGPFHLISQDYREFNLNPPSTGLWTLGLYYPLGRCRIETGDSCKTLPTKGKIDGFIGSSE